ncbi:hypothetical protein DFQ26_007232 [Actinomortierella ambigua]|nr:hypothetical protein DFQ26_007232 [Actinomortierella ambigua]
MRNLQQTLSGSVRLGSFAGLVLALAVTSYTTSTSLTHTLSTTLLGILIGFVVAETPLSGPFQELVGLVSRSPDKVGLDVLHGTLQEQRATDEDTDASSRLLDQRTMYGLQHAFLNLEVTGWWFNMGLWPDKSEQQQRTTRLPFRDACKALVRKVVHDIGINEQSSILDVGFGCGDQDVYMAQQYKPGKITGITIESIQHHAAEQLVKHSEVGDTKIALYVADASKLPEFLAAHPQVLGGATGTGEGKSFFTHVVSIDSAYHYRTRRQFLENAFRYLQPGGIGRLAMADMVLAKPAPTSAVGRWVFEKVFEAIQVPPTNMKSLAEYRHDLEEVGFQDIEIECVEERVFAGLADHIEAQLGQFGGLVKPNVHWTYRGLVRGLRWLAASGWIHFVVVKARRP